MTRKIWSNNGPNSGCGGYICEVQSRHPKLPGAFVLIDLVNGGDWAADAREENAKYAVFHVGGGGLITFSSKAHGIHAMRVTAAGEDLYDFGQFEVK